MLLHFICDHTIAPGELSCLVVSHLLTGIEDCVHQERQTPQSWKFCYETVSWKKAREQLYLSLKVPHRVTDMFYLNLYL